MTIPNIVDSVGILYAVGVVERKRMIKNIEVMSEAIRNSKHPFRKTESTSKKALKNRHERRKIKEYLHLGDWTADESM